MNAITKVPRDERDLIALADMLLRVSALASFQLSDGRLKDLIHYLVHDSGLEGSTLEAAVAFVVCSHQDDPDVPIDVIAELHIDAAKLPSKLTVGLNR